MNRLETSKLYRIPRNRNKRNKTYGCGDIRVIDPATKETIRTILISDYQKAATAKKKLSKKYQQELRENPTLYEKKLKRHLMAIAQEYKIKCIPQYIFRFKPYFFILDFYFTKAKLCIEVDGSHHQEPQQLQYDQERTRMLEKHGMQVLRFSNKEVYEDLQGVCETIKQTVGVRVKTGLVEQTKRCQPVQARNRRQAKS
uniref:DUF559 domain-containing protein n=1 Tax=viral metagenome TaxID=1070528 RepID=A0A6M3JAX6_9ZZZZ